MQAGDKAIEVAQSGLLDLSAEVVDRLPGLAEKGVDGARTVLSQIDESWRTQFIAEVAKQATPRLAVSAVHELTGKIGRGILETTATAWHTNWA